MHQKWNGHFFKKAPLSTLGLRIQLEHDGDHCSMPVPALSNFLVFDVSGVHQVNVNFCGCGPTYELDKHIQLLWKRWFPATTTRPQTIFTFECLNTFHELTLQGKTMLYDFYHVLLRKTDNANVHPSIVCIFFCTLFLIIDLSQSHSTNTPKCIALFACGKIWCLSSTLARGMILQVWMAPRLVDWWLNVRLALTLAITYLRDGKRQACYCELSSYLFVNGSGDWTIV